MASRNSASVPMLSAITVFALGTLVFFVLFVVFLAKSQRLGNDLDTAKSDRAAAIRDDEKDDRWEEIKRQAQAAGGKGAVRYLDQSLSDTMKLVTGNRKETPEGLKEKISKSLGEGAAPLWSVLASKDKEIADLNAKLAQAQADRNNAQDDLKAASDRIAKIQEENRATVTALNAEIGGIKGELDRYRAGVEDTQSSMEKRVEDLRAENSRTGSELQGKVDSLQQELLVKQEQLDKALGKNEKERLKPGEESALVDARIVGVNPGSNQVYVGVGRKQHAVLGMTFEIYSVGTIIRPDAEGNYPQGKASIELVRVDENSSLARITRQARGNPVIPGDAAANAVYDPKKTYTFCVFGNFDTNNDSVPTPQESADIEALIRDWGGQLSDGISGSTDFLVLGDRPILPPEPKPEDPIELIQRYLKLKQNVQRYDELLDTAKRTSIPILNQNRLFTLTGFSPQR